MRKILKLSGGILLFILFTISCNSKKSSDSKLSGDIKIDGSSTVYPITEAVAEEFRAVHPNVRVTVGVSGTGGGFKNLQEMKLKSVMPLDQLKTKKPMIVKITIFHF